MAEEPSDPPANEPPADLRLVVGAVGAWLSVLWVLGLPAEWGGVLGGVALVAALGKVVPQKLNSS